MARKIIAVIGIGRFGFGLIKSLSTLNVDVIAIDKSKEALAPVDKYVRDVFVCDSTNYEMLEQTGVTRADEVIVTYGQDYQASLAVSILTVIALNKLNVKHITVRVDDANNAEVMLKVGANSVVPVFDLASERLALRIGSKDVLDYFHLAGGYSVYEVPIEEDVKPISLMDLKAPTKFKINILLYTRDGNTYQPDRDYIIQPGDHIFVLGEINGVKKMQRFLKKDRD